MDIVRSAFVSLRHFALAKAMKLPVLCYRHSIFTKHSTACVTVGHRLLIGNRVTYLSDQISAVHIRKQANLVVTGVVSLGPGVVMIVHDGASCQIGDGSYVAADSKIYASESITIGEGCAVSWNVTIIDSDFHHIRDQSEIRPMSSPITIGNHVWIGCNVTILKGVSIGNGAIIAAGSVVVHDVPAGCLAAGNPARVVKQDVEWC